MDNKMMLVVLLLSAASTIHAAVIELRLVDASIASGPAPFDAAGKERHTLTG